MYNDCHQFYRNKVGLFHDAQISSICGFFIFASVDIFVHMLIIYYIAE